MCCSRHTGVRSHYRTRATAACRMRCLSKPDFAIVVSSSRRSVTKLDVQSLRMAVTTTQFRFSCVTENLIYDSNALASLWKAPRSPSRITFSWLTNPDTQFFQKSRKKNSRSPVFREGVHTTLHTLSFRQSLKLQVKQGETPESGNSVHALEQTGASLCTALAKFAGSLLYA